MKTLESLNNSLYEKFENNKINNLALCLGGTVYNTQGNLGKDYFNTETSTKDAMKDPISGGVVNGDWYAARNVQDPGPESFI